MNTPRCLIDGQDTTRIEANDRGLLYGDGVFETCLFIDGRAALWPRHMTRLRDGCARLGIGAPDTVALEREANHVAAGLARAVVRVTVTRGVGERGYAPPHDARPRRMVSAFAAPRVEVDWYRHGIRVRWCRTRLAQQPQLAGIKHLNRLEQVLARAEWSDGEIGEGLMRDVQDNLIGATAANVFAVIDGTLVTPGLERSGVAGVMRAQVLEWSAGTQVRTLGANELMLASEVFLTNALRGVVPVRALEATAWPVGPVASALMARAAALGLPPQGSD